MKVMKSLLLGSAAGLVAVSGAQAADLPVKAKPVEYVKICSAYGAGFYYIPGTDICLRVGGAVRADYYHHAVGAFPHIAQAGAGSPGTYNRDEESHAFRGRGYWILDARQNTAYGTLRAFVNGYISWTSSGAGGAGPDAINADRAFIQFAGFTFGRAQSFFDFYSFTGAYANLVTYNSSGTGATGWNVLAYTAQLGNGVSATISLEDQRRKAVVTGATNDLNDPIGDPWGVGTQTTFTVVPATGFFLAGGPATNRRAGQNVPAVVGNIRVDQSWGSAQIMGAVQEVRGTYLTGVSSSNQLGSDWGYAFGGGFTWNNPSAPGSVFGVQANWAKGAMGYVASTYTNHAIYETNHKMSVGFLADAIAIGPNVTDLELTQGWGVNVGYQHRFNPNWAWSIGGGYTQIEYGPLATLAACGPFANCLDFSFWSVGSRLNWTPVAGLNIGLDVMYQNYESQFGGLFAPIGAGTGSSRPQCGLTSNNTVVPCNTTDQEVWTAMLRVQRDF